MKIKLFKKKNLLKSKKNFQKRIIKIIFNTKLMK